MVDDTDRIRDPFQSRKADSKGVENLSKHEEYG